MHTCLSLYAVGFCLALPTAILAAVEGVHLHSELQHLLPLLLLCCDSSPLEPAHQTTVPDMSGYSCPRKHMADIQSGTASSGRGRKVGKSLADACFLCEQSGSLGESAVSFNDFQFPAFPLCILVSYHVGDG